MRRSSHAVANPFEETIKGLKEELFMARHTVIDLMPESVQNVLQTYYHCVTVEDTYGWLHDVIDDLIDLAEVLPPVPFYFGDRGNCPLCGDGPNSPYDKGFALPDGLRMHLEGKGNAHQCGVMREAWAMALSHWDREFHPRWSKAHEDKQAALKVRRSKEIQYLVHPYVAPRLIEEGLRYSQVRDQKGLAWVEARLAELGFSTGKAARIRAYTKETANAVVYADPRVAGSIPFTVLLKPIEEGLPRWKSRRVPAKHFGIRDGWKKDLEKKVDGAIAEAVKELLPALKLVE